MNTLMLILSITLFVLALIGTGWYYIYWGVQKSNHKDNQRWKTLYKVEEERHLEHVAKRRLLDPTVMFWAGFVMLLSVGLMVLSAKNLSRLECQQNNGEFKSWDGGFQWECYNPNQINQENNLRIIHAEEE